jgi:hypothetical protein
MKKLIFTTAITALAMLGFHMTNAQVANPYATGITVLPNIPAVGQQFDFVISMGNNDDASGPIPINTTLWTINVPTSVTFSYTVGTQIPGTPFYVYSITYGTSAIVVLKNNIELPSSTPENTSERRFEVQLPATSNAEILGTSPNISVNVALDIGQGTVGNNSPGDDNATGTLAVIIPLPVRLQAFTAKTNGCDAVLNWQVTKEDNFNGYDVQYSTNGTEFKSLAFIRGGKSAYTFTNSQKEEIGFYRLKMIDNDGSFALSEVLRLGVDCNKTQAELYPNPAQDLLYVNRVKAGATIALSNITGAVLNTIKATDGINKLQISELVAGQYFITIQEEGQQSTTLRFVKK